MKVLTTWNKGQVKSHLLKNNSKYLLLDYEFVVFYDFEFKNGYSFSDTEVRNRFHYVVTRNGIIINDSNPSVLVDLKIGEHHSMAYGHFYEYS